MTANSAVMISKAAVSLGRLFCSNLRLVLLASFAVLIVAAFAAPLLESTPLSSVSAAIYGLDSHLCHQISGRCLHIAGLPFAICARCFGGYLGFLIAGLIFTRRSVLSNAIRRFIMLLGFIGLLDIAFQIAQIYSTGNILRLISGAALGLASGMLAFRFVGSIEDSLESEFTSAVQH